MSEDTQADVEARIWAEVLTDNERKLIGRAIAGTSHAELRKWTNLLLRAYDGQAACLAAQEAALRNACADMAGTHVEAEALYHAYLRSPDSGDGAVTDNSGAEIAQSFLDSGDGA